MSSTNSINLFVTISTKEVLRFSPSGISILKFSVEHQSEQMEDQNLRRVKLDLDCVAFGDRAVSLDRLGIGQQLLLSGFLMNKGARSKWPIFNVQKFEEK